MLAVGEVTSGSSPLYCLLQEANAKRVRATKRSLVYRVCIISLIPCRPVGNSCKISVSAVGCKRNSIEKAGPRYYSSEDRLFI